MSSGSVNDRGRQLVGRRHERAQLVSALEALRHRTATFVALSGEPGIGKTRLFEELAAAAEQHAWLVLKGRGADLEGEMPFAVWVDALDEHVAWLGADRLRRMVGDQLGELARVLPSARAEQRAPEMALPDERYRAHWAVRALLERIARARPLVVLLDDVHWADGASLELIMHLLRRPLPAPVLIGLAFRSGRLSPSMLDAGDPAAAAQLAQRAAERADAVGAVIHAARSAVLAGRALAAAGAREAALTTLADAEANLTAYGAHRLRDEAARELRRLGRRMTARQRRTSPSPGSPALSGREREIAELVALGRTNREIAAELFLSEKTVEGHLSHVFTKFGVRSRAAVATTIARTRTTPP